MKQTHLNILKLNFRRKLHKIVVTFLGMHCRVTQVNPHGKILFHFQLEAEFVKPSSPSGAFIALTSLQWKQNYFHINSHCLVAYALRQAGDTDGDEYVNTKNKWKYKYDR
jgi:hypothetical protein